MLTHLVMLELALLIWFAMQTDYRQRRVLSKADLIDLHTLLLFHYKLTTLTVIAFTRRYCDWACLFVGSFVMFFMIGLSQKV